MSRPRTSWTERLPTWGGQAGSQCAGAIAPTTPVYNKYSKEQFIQLKGLRIRYWKVEYMSDSKYEWNFSPAPDILLALYGPHTSLVYGKIARFCMMKDQVCKASIGRIAQVLARTLYSVGSNYWMGSDWLRILLRTKGMFPMNINSPPGLTSYLLGLIGRDQELQKPEGNESSHPQRAVWRKRKRIYIFHLNLSFNLLALLSNLIL